MPITTCRVCLRTDLTLRELVPKTQHILKELCENYSDHSKHYCCFICEHLLLKSYLFKKRCQESNKILKQWRSSTRNRLQLSELHKYLPISPYGSNKANCKEIHIIESNNLNNVFVKVEKYDKVDCDEFPTLDTCKEHYDNNNIENNNDSSNIANNDSIENDYDIVKVDNDGIANNDDIENDHQNIVKVEFDNIVNNDNGDIVNNGAGEIANNCNSTSDSDEGRCLLDYVKESKRKVKTKSRKSKQKKTIIKIEDLKPVSDKPKISVPKKRRPLKDHKEYETVFNIQLFSSDAEVKEEFAQRKNSERYLSAKHKCDICFTVYKCEKLVSFHKRWHDPAAGEFPCEVCSMRFKSSSSLRKHKTDVHYGRYQCKECPLITYHKMVMILHYRKHQGVSYVCKICNRTYNHSSTYMSHLRKSHRTEHVCVTCAQTFVSEKGLAVHRKKVHNTTSNVEPHGTPCEPCGVTFANEQVYTIHLLNTDRHKDLAKTLTACPECGKSFEDKLQVRAHRREAHPQYNYSAMQRAASGLEWGKCTLCGLSGTHNTWLYHHFQTAHPTHCYELNVRSDRRKHLCDQCGKSFYNITQLREHGYSHSGLKPFRCDKCPAAFRCKSHLKFHSERHSPPSRACSQCGKKFASAANLSNHMRCHIGDRRYLCSLCGKGFLHRAALREHVRGVHLHMRRERANRR